MTDTNKILPKLRFPKFSNDGEWDVVKFKDVFTMLSNNTLSRAELNEHDGNAFNVHYGDVLIKFGERLDLNNENLPHIKDDSTIQKSKSSYLKDGDIIFADTAEDETAGKCTEIRNIGERIVLSGLHTIPCRPKDSFAPYYWGYYLNSNAYHTKLLPLMQGAKVTSISRSSLQETTVVFPHSFLEQQRIASLLTSLDEQISAHKKKLETLKAHKKSLMQQLFPANGEKTPKLRFPEFKNAGEWKSTTLGQITNVINRRNKSKRELPIYSISNKNGFILQNEQFDGLDSNKRGYDISMYKIVGKNTFAYNPARINIGSIGYSGNLSEIQISSLYVCFKTTEDADDSFLQYFFDSFKFNNAVESNVEGGIRSYLFYENFSKIRIDIPSLSEQKKIASCFNTINVNIKTNSEKTNALEQQKIGLMQKLFPICFK